MIPAHNEAENIGLVVAGVCDVLSQRFAEWEVVLVDDASSDATAEVATQALGADAHRLVVVRHDTKRGYAATVTDGLRAAHGRLLAFMDGDRQFDPRDLGRLIDRMPEYDMVAGIRAKRADPWYRSVVSGVMNLLVRTLYGVRRHDVDCGLKVFRREVFESASPLLAHSALFNTEMFFKADRLGYRVLQVPVEHLPRVAGRRSGARLVPILRALRDVVLLRLRLALRWHAAPSPSAWRFALAALVVFALARLPSLWEPHWYTDEAGYVTTAQTLLNGHTLYSQIWTNKPPLAVLVVAAIVNLFGTGELPLHLLTFASGLATVGAVFYTSWRLLTPRRAVIASVFAALALGLPVLDAELLIPESLLIAPVSWAGALLAVRLFSRGETLPARPRGVVAWPFIAGVLVAIAVGLQQSALAETLAFTLALLISPVARLRDAAAFLATALVITGAWLLAAIATAGAHTVAYALIGFYIPFTQSVLPEGHGALLHFAAAMLGGVLFVFGALPLRRSPRPTWFFLLWAGASLMVAGVSGQPYAHYLLPAAAPLALALASLRRIPLHGVTRARLNTGLRLTPQIAGVLIAAFMASNAGLDWVSSPTPSSVLFGGAPINNSRNFGVYYGGAIAAAFGVQTRDDWDAGFDSRVLGDGAAADYIRNQGLAGTTAVVWSSDAWIYALAELPDLMPTPPIYNDEVLLGQNGPVADYVSTLNPEVIVTSTDALVQFPEITKLLDSKYVASYWYYPNLVWLRADIAPNKL